MTTTQNEIKYNEIKNALKNADKPSWIGKLAVLAASLLLIFLVLFLSFTLFICPFIDSRLPICCQVYEQCEQKQIIKSNKS